jgi:plastocyanin
MNPIRACATALPALLAGFLLACGATDLPPLDPADLELTKPEGASGDGQVGVAGEVLPESLRVLVTRDGEPVEGVTVVWFTIEGVVNPATVVTGPDGMAATTWAPMLLFAEQFASARIDGEGGAAVGFLAVATPDPDDRNTVLVGGAAGNQFQPENLTVATGGSVNWFWPEGSAGHNIVPDDGDSPPSSGALEGWPMWHVFRFPTPGVYRYYCAAHGGPGGVGMSGTITVQDPSSFSGSEPTGEGVSSFRRR